MDIRSGDITISQYSLVYINTRVYSWRVYFIYYIYTVL